MKTNRLFAKATLATGLMLTTAGTAQAAWYDDVADWFVDTGTDIVEWTEDAAAETANWFDENIISPIGVVFDTIDGVIAYEELVADSLGDYGYTSSGGLSYTAPTDWAANSGTLNVATFNVHGFPEVLNGETDEDVAKMSTLVERWGFDIVGFQEDWVVNPALVSNLTNETYPYRSNHFAGEPGTLGDGLMTASKHPMNRDSVQRRQWSQCNGTLLEYIEGKVNSPDCITEKGFTIAEVAIAKDFVVHFYNMHGNTGDTESINQSDLDDMKAALNGYSADYPVVVVGDFNMGYDDTEQTVQLDNWLADTGMTFTCQYESEPCGNKIDLIAFRGNDQFELSWNSSTEHVDNLAEDPSQDKLSDHRPHSAVLGWTNMNPSLAEDLSSASWNWKAGHPKIDDTLRNCALAKSNGQWVNWQCNASYTKEFACEDDTGNWEVAGPAGTFDDGELTCQSLGDDWFFSAPTNSESNDALTAVTTGTVFLNYTDEAVEGEWILSLGDRVVVDNREPDSLSFSNTDGFRLNEGESITTLNRRLKMHDANGSLFVVKYNYLTKTEGGAIWQVADENYTDSYAVFQGDGNFVVYGPNGPKWATNTQDAAHGGNGGRTLRLQGDGNLAIYDGNGNHLWNAATHNAQGAELGFTNQVKVALKSDHGNYLRAENGGGGSQRVTTKTSSPGVWAQFDLISTDGECVTHGDKVYLLGYDNYYWGAWGSGELWADSGNANDWQSFTFYNNTDTTGCLEEGDSISLKSFHNKFVVAEGNNQNALANRTAIGPWEKFTVEFH